MGLVRSGPLHYEHCTEHAIRSEIRITSFHPGLCAPFSSARVCGFPWAEVLRFPGNQSAGYMSAHARFHRGLGLVPVKGTEKRKRTLFSVPFQKRKILLLTWSTSPLCNLDDKTSLKRAEE